LKIFSPISFLVVALLSCLSVLHSHAQSNLNGLEQGIAHYNEGQPVAALTHLLHFVKSKKAPDSETAKANYYIGRLFAESGLHEKSLAYLLEAEKQNSNDQQLQRELKELAGDQYLQLKKPQKARGYYLQLAESESGKLDEKVAVYQKIASSYQSSTERKYDSTLYYNQRILELAQASKNGNLQIKAYNNLGYTYHFLKDYKKAIEAFDQALLLAAQTKQSELQGQIMLNQAIVLNNRGQQTKAVKKLKDARGFIFSAPHKEKHANYYNLLAGFYFKLGDLYNAELYNDSALVLSDKQNDPYNEMQALALTAQIKNFYSDYKAENRFQQLHDNLRDSLNQESQQQNQLALLQAFDLERQENKTIIAIQDSEITQEKADKAEQGRMLAVEKAKVSEQEKQMVQQLADLLERDKKLALARAISAENERELALKDLRIQYEMRIGDSIDNQLEKEKLIRSRLSEARQLDKARADKATQAKELEINKREKLLGFSGLLVLILILVLISLIYIRRANRKLKASNLEISENRKLIALEKEKSDELLLNILPEKTAAELKLTGSSAPKHYDQASVLFTDFKGFTGIAENLSPTELIDELNLYFKAFDQIMEEHNIEKIKTIGDAYMCAGGIPEPNETNAFDTVSAAIDMMVHVKKVNADKAKNGLQGWGIRIGIHTGPIVAGVVGQKKFAYDIWGDAVNTASRMETAAEVNRINITQQTYDLVKDRIKCSFRGELDAKNKGKIAMYFVDEDTS